MDEGYELKNIMEFCLKDETRDLERVRLGKTRVFLRGFCHSFDCYSYGYG